MGLVNYLIMAIDNTGYRGWIYQGWIVIVYIVVAIFNLFWRRHYGYKWFRTLLITLACLLSFDLFLMLVGWALTGFVTFGVKDYVAGCLFVPLLVMAFGKVFRDDWRKMLDFMTPGYMLALVIIKISCCFAGCCFSFPMAHGMWNPIFEQYLFPLQIVEGAVALLLTFVLMYIAKKRDYRVTGNLYAWLLILYGGTRFFLEFARVNVKVVAGISVYGFWALLTLLVGIIWLIADRRRTRTLAEAETEVETEAEETQD